LPNGSGGGGSNSARSSPLASGNINSASQLAETLIYLGGGRQAGM